MSSDLKDVLAALFILFCFGVFFYGAPILFTM